MAGESERTPDARALAEAALVRIAQHLDSVDIPLVVLGGLVPELLCTTTGVRHQGTIDVDIQINLEVEVEGAHASELEQALLASGFSVDPAYAWRWVDRERGTIVKVEFLCDLDYEPAESLVRFRSAETLAAINLRGTGYASRDWDFKDLSASIDGRRVSATVRFAALAGYLLAKAHALLNRRLAKDMYDFAYVLIHNDAGGPEPAANQVTAAFGNELPSLHATLSEVAASFSSPTDTGPTAYARLAFDSDPEADRAQLAADAYASVATFIRLLYP